MTACHRATIVAATASLLMSTAVATAHASAAGSRATVTAVNHVKAVAAPGAVRFSWTTPSGATDDTVEIVQGGEAGYYPPDPSMGTPEGKVDASAGSFVDTEPFGIGRVSFSVFTADSDGNLAASHAKVDATLVAPKKATAFTAIYAVPKGTTPKSRTGAIRTDIAEVSHWYDTQTHGKVPRFITKNGKPTVHVLRLSITAQKLHSAKTDSIGEVKAAIANAGVPADEMPVVYVEGGWAGEGAACGVDGGPVALLWMSNCGGIYPSTSDTWPYGATYLTAHEMTHAMGAVQSCAPHSTGDGHVNDSRKDVLYEGPLQRAWKHLVLDYNHDDYYDSHNANCPSINADAVWMASTKR
jgi:hypothetical protein